MDDCNVRRRKLLDIDLLVVAVADSVVGDTLAVVHDRGRLGMTLLVRRMLLDWMWGVALLLVAVVGEVGSLLVEVVPVGTMMILPFVD